MEQYELDNKNQLSKRNEPFVLYLHQRQLYTVDFKRRYEIKTTLIYI